MKKLLALFSLISSLNIFAQSPRVVVVEHLTNSACSICASKNPAFYQVLSGYHYPQVLHISIHPSSPHSNCVFSLQNKDENDARTMYYNAFGYTPVIVLNGTVLPGTNPLISNAQIDTLLSQTSAVEIAAYELPVGADSVYSRVVVKTTGSISNAPVRLFAGVAEEPIHLTTPNGETLHHDVFQKALTAVTGDTFSLPALNDSLVFNFRYQIKSGWNADSLYTFALVQRSDTKEVLNGTKSTRVTAFVTALPEIEEESFYLYPNPTSSELQISGIDFAKRGAVMIYDLTGRKVLETQVAANRINVSSLQNGTYVLEVGGVRHRFIKN